MGRLPIAWGIALLAMSGVFASSASASHCGRYALGDSQLRRELAGLFDATVADRPGSPPPATPTCNGPSCSGQPAAPILPAVVPVAPVEDWALPACPAVLGDRGSSLLSRDEADARPIHRGPAIFHPPRRPLG